MSWIGRRVVTDRWGPGVVQAQKLNGYELLIQFDNGLVYWVRRDETRPEEQGSGPVIIGGGEGTVDPPIEPVFDPQTIDRMRAIEAFKLGIVPPYVKEFIFGRDEEINKVKKWLESERKNTLVVYGEYGSGKSHFLKYVKDLAMEDGWVVSLCTLDPAESPLYKPKNVYRNVVSNISYDGDKKHFRDLITEIRAKKRSREQTKNQYFDAMLQEPFCDELFWRWLEGDDVIKSIYKYPTLPTATTCANIYCNLLSGLSYYIKEKLGLKGLVVLFDEAESVDFAGATANQVSRGKNLLKGLRLTSDNDENLDEDVSREHGRYAYSTTNTGSRTGLVYSGQDKISYLFNDECSLKILFAFTPNPVVQQICFEMGFREPIPLNRLDLKTRRIIVATLQALYINTFDGVESDKQELEYMSASCLNKAGVEIRALVKSTIEAIELRRNWPETPIKKLLE